MTSRDPHSTPLDETEQPPAQVAGPSGEGQPPESEGSSTNEHSSASHESEHARGGDSPYETQSNLSDITLQSRIPGAAGVEGGSVESDPRGSSEHVETSSSVTFPVHSHDRPSDDSGHSGGHPSWSPSSPPSPSSRLPSRGEITEVSSSSEQESEAPSGSVVSIIDVVPDTPSRKTPKLNSRKRRHFWPNLKLSGGNLRKRLCCCFPTTKQSEDMDSSNGSDGGFKIRDKPVLEEGILRSDVAMNSVTVRQVEEVIRQHGDFITVLTGEKLRHYERRMSALLASQFERDSGCEILRLWRLDATRPAKLYVEMLPTQTSERRVLTLRDVRLLDPPRDELFDPRDDSLFRYFMSCEGLGRHNMLIPAHA